MIEPPTPPGPPDEPPGAAVAPPAAPVNEAARETRDRAALVRATYRLVALFGGALVACGLAYLAWAVPGPWFTGAKALAWGAGDLQVARGTSRIVGDELHVVPGDASGIIVVSVRTRFSSADQDAVAWIAIDVPDDVEASLLWRTDYKPEALNTLPLSAIGGRLLPARVRGNPAWIGRIDGLALAVRGPITEPIRIRGVTVQPQDAPQIVRERFREWFAFEGWTGTSINTITGGADLQDLPLPLFLAFAAVIATLAVALLRRWRPALFPLGVTGTLAAFLLGAWLLLDVRWTVNLAQQAALTASTFAFRGYDERRLAVEDGPLYGFVAKARELLPKEPVRIFIAADSHYFRGRAAYHLLPHRVFFDPRANNITGPEGMRPGDWVLVYQRKGVQYDASQAKLRWNNLAPIAAELKLAARGAALFLIK